MNSEKRYSCKARQHIFLLLAVCLLVGILPSASALDLSSVPLEKVGVDWDNVDSFTKTKDTSIYGKYEIRNSILNIPFLQLSKVADIELKNNLSNNRTTSFNHGRSLEIRTNTF